MAAGDVVGLQEIGVAFVPAYGRVAQVFMFFVELLDELTVPVVLDELVHVGIFEGLLNI